MGEALRRARRLSSFQIISLGFAAVDLVGALALMLPLATQSRCVTPFREALFTSTSALCVTGLVVRDTGSYWSVFGQSVILVLTRSAAWVLSPWGRRWLCWQGARSP